MNEAAVEAVAGFEEKLEKALRLGGFRGHTLGGLMQKLAMDEAQIFRNDGGVLITEILASADGPVLNIWLTAGELDAVVELSRQAVAAAEEYGCVAATFTGRRGWERVPAVTEDGWRPTATIFSRSLGG